MSVVAIQGTTPQVIWYGERGIVNALVTNVSRTGDITRHVQSMLSAVLWASGSAPSWIQAIASAALVIEVGLGDFGDPDVLAVCRTADDLKLVFIEAKADSYLASMVSTAPTNAIWGMAQDGFNSSVNGQLSLKYRFAKALSAWDGNASEIVETSEMFAAYQKVLNDVPPKHLATRKLAKRKILNEIFKPLGLAGIPETSCYYVALTWDISPKAYFRCPEVPNDCLPVFLNEAGVGLFHNMSDRVGWLGWSALGRCLPLHDAQEYQLAFRTMLDTDEPPLSYNTKFGKKRWAAFPRAHHKIGSRDCCEFQRLCATLQRKSHDS